MIYFEVRASSPTSPPSPREGFLLYPSRNSTKKTLTKEIGTKTRRKVNSSTQEGSTKQRHKANSSTEEGRTKQSHKAEKKTRI